MSLLVFCSGIKYDMTKNFNNRTPTQLIFWPYLSTHLEIYLDLEYFPISCRKEICPEKTSISIYLNITLFQIALTNLTFSAVVVGVII